MRVVKAGSMQWSKHKVQRISCIENTTLESKREGNASTFCSPLPTSSLLARFRRTSSRVIFAQIVQLCQPSQEYNVLIVYDFNPVQPCILYKS